MKRCVTLVLFITSWFVLVASTHYDKENSTRGGGYHTVYFDGENAQHSYIALGDFGYQQVFTVSMWVKPDSIQGDNAVILDCNHDNNDNWVIQRVGDTSDWTFKDAVFSLQFGVWQHIAITAQNGVTNVYVNGKSVCRASSGLIDYRRKTDLILGNSNLGGRTFHGLIDELHISSDIRYAGDFTPALSETAVASTYGLWHFFEGSGTVCIDSSVLANNATLINSVSWSNEWPGLLADFTAIPEAGAAPLTVSFSDKSTGNPTIWRWDFENDGIIDSKEQNPIHTYDKAGIYSVELQVQNSTQKNRLLKVNDITVN